LGVLPGAAFAASHTRLGPGDALVFYSDGATEARSADDEELGFDGLDRVLRQSGADTADALVATVVDAVDRWAAGADAEDDDLTVVAVRREG
jgi:sigma-B regulation protein RsbU (phosphoserine phosphatase)